MALPDWVVILGVCGGIATSLATLIRARPEGRKLDRDGVAAINTSAGTILTSVRDEMTDLRSEVREMRAWRAGLERRLRRHAPWDERVVAVIRGAGLVVDDPPPLYDESEL